MTGPKDLLHPLEPAQRLAKADRDALDALLAELTDCTTLIATAHAARQQETATQLERLQACAAAVGRLSEQIGAAGNDDAARHAELTAAMRQIPAAVTTLVTGLDAAGTEHAAGIRSDIAALGGTLASVAGTCEQHNRCLLAMTDAVTALITAVAVLRLETQAERARQAQTSPARTLGDLLKGRASLGARVGNFEQVLARYRTDFWLHAVAIPLLFGVAFGCGLMTDIVIQYLDGLPGTSAPPVAELLPWPLPDASRSSRPWWQRFTSWPPRRPRSRITRRTAPTPRTTRSTGRRASGTGPRRRTSTSGATWCRRASSRCSPARCRRAASAWAGSSRARGSTVQAGTSPSRRPKSVSLEALVMGDERVIRTHDEAVRANLDWFERDLLQTRGWDPVTKRRPRVQLHMIT